MSTLALFIHQPPQDWRLVQRYVKQGGIVIAGHFSHVVYANIFQTQVPKGIWHGSCHGRGFPEQHKFNESDHLWRTLADGGHDLEPSASVGSGGCGPSTFSHLGLRSSDLSGRRWEEGVASLFVRNTVLFRHPCEKPALTSRSADEVSRCGWAGWLDILVLQLVVSPPGSSDNCCVDTVTLFNRVWG